MSEPLSREYLLWDGHRLVVSVTDEDPGDIGEPRSVEQDGVTYLSVRATLDARPALDVAWTEVEAALPEGWCDLMVYHYDDEPGAEHTPGRYGAKTMDPHGRKYGEVVASGTTPADALRALAAILAAKKDADR